jgi:hypothetical protein
MGPKPDQLMLAGPHSAIVGILAQILRPKYLIDPVNDPAGNFGKQIQETRPFQKLREHGIDPRILHNLCVAFRLLKRVKKQEAQLRQARKELVRGRKHIRAAARAIPSLPTDQAELEELAEKYGRYVERLKGIAVCKLSQTRGRVTRGGFTVSFALWPSWSLNGLSISRVTCGL